MKSSRLLIAGAVASLLPFAGAFAQSPTPDQVPQPAQQRASFESLDTDSDGKISKTEAAADKNVNDQFASYDANGNGFIERDEVNAANAANTAPPAEPPKQ